jgi:hypothetical protein
MKTRRATLKSFIAANAAVFAMLAAPAAVDHFYSTDLGMMPAAYAQDSVGKGSLGKPAGKGHQGQGGATNDTGGSGSGQGGPGVDSDAKGPRYMGGTSSQKGSAAKGGSPVWAKDALIYNGTTTELGRLNVARAPQRVFDRQLVEALAALSANEALYDLTSVDAVIAAILAEDPKYVRVDSPLANLALLKDLLADGQVGDLTLDASPALLQALFLASASDKTLPISDATVFAVYTIIGAPIPSAADISAIATAAESIRLAIQTAHDN